MLDHLSAKYPFPGFLVVRLNGMVHTTDVLAVRAIARQLYLLDDLNAEHEFAHELKQVSSCALRRYQNLRRRAAAAREICTCAMRGGACVLLRSVPGASLLRNFPVEHCSLRCMCVTHT